MGNMCFKPMEVEVKSENVIFTTERWYRRIRNKTTAAAKERVAICQPFDRLINEAIPVQS